jgi:phosphoglycolate phosphatase
MTSSLLFDFDGTIADTFDLTLKIGRSIMDSLKLHHLSEEEIINFRNRPFRESFRSMKIPLRKIPSLIIRIRRGIHDHIDEVKPFEGIPEALRIVRSRVGFMGMVTSNSEKNVTRFLDRFNMRLFDSGSYSSSILGKASKLRRLIRKNNIVKQETVYVGDTVDDIEACKKVGIRVAAVTWGYNGAEILKQSEPDYIIERIEDLCILTSQP